jgi:hypothetical protein
MATTLASLAGTKQTTQVQNANSGAVGSAGGSSIQATKSVDNSAKLWNDIGKGSANVVQEMQQASTYAGERVGTDNLVEYKSGMNQIAAYYADQPQTSSMMVAKSRNEEALYKKHMTKGHFGDNELANQAFKDTYASPAYDNLLRSQTVNNTKRVALFKDETIRDVTAEMKMIDFDLGETNLKSFKQRYKNAGLDPEGVVTLYTTLASGSVTTEMNDYPDTYHNAAGVVNSEAVDAMIDQKYRLVLSSDDKALQDKVSAMREKAHNYIDSKGIQARNKYFSEAKTLANSMLHFDTPWVDENGTSHYAELNPKKFEKTIDNKFGLLSKPDKTAIMDMWREKTQNKGASNAMVTDWEKRVEKFIEDPNADGQVAGDKTYEALTDLGNSIINNLDISATKKTNMKWKMENYTRLKEDFTIARDEIQTLTKEELRSRVENGFMKDGGSILDGGTYVKVINKQLRDTSKAISEIDMGGENAGLTYVADLEKLEKLQFAKNGKLPSIETDFNNTLTTGLNVTNMSKNDMLQMAAYIDFASLRSPAEYKHYQKEMKGLIQIFDKVDTAEGGSFTEDMALISARGKLKYTTSESYLKKQSPEVMKAFTDAVVDRSQGGGEGWTGTVSFINTDVPEGTASILRDMYHGLNTPEAIAKHVSGFSAVDFGGVGFDTNRVLMPKNFTNETMFRNVVGALVKKGQEDNSEIDEDSLEFQPHENGGLWYELYANVGGKRIYLGNINKEIDDKGKD